MECDTYQEHMSLWIDDRLTPHEIRQIEAHTATCPSCRASLEALRRLDRLFSAAPLISPAPGFGERFQAKLAARRRRHHTWAGLLTLTLATLALMLGASVVLVISGLTLWGNLSISGLLPQATGLLLDLGQAMIAALELGWLIVSALARGLQHPVFIAYLTATAILIAAWTQIVRRRVLAHGPVSANLNV